MHVESHTRRNGECRPPADVSRRLPDARAMLAPGWYRPVKTAKDSVLAILLLVLAAPLILAAAALVKLTSRGPAMYAQTRVGRGGRPYTLYKLRSMIHNCEQLTGPRWATPRDPRITPVGRILRRTHL